MKAKLLSAVGMGQLVLCYIRKQSVLVRMFNRTLDGIRLDFKTLRIYISAHVVSTSFKVLINVC